VIRTWWAVLLLAAGAHAHAELLALAPAPLDAFAPGSHDRFATRVVSAQSAEYTAVIKAYDDHLAVNPDAYRVRIERCRFIERFAYSEDSFIEGSEDDLENCRKTLVEGPHKRQPAVLLYDLEHRYDDEDLATAEKLLPESRLWPKADRVALLELLSQRNTMRNPDAAAAYAIDAVELDPGSSVLLAAVDRWVQLGAKETALRLLRNAPESTWKRVPRTTAAQTFIDLGDAKSAAALLRGADKLDTDYGGDLTLARALSAANDFDAARKLYREAVTGEYTPNATRVEVFQFELRHGTPDEAAAAYEELRDHGDWTDPLARQRMGLLFASPGAPWHFRDALGLLTLVGVLLLFFTVPLLVVMPVHYRGLARRVAGRDPDLAAPPWKLRHAIYALGAFLTTGYVGLYVYAPQLLESMLPGTEIYATESITDLVLGKYLLVTTLAALLLAMPLMRGRSLREVLLGRWSILKHVLVGLGCGIGLKFIAALIGIATSDPGALGSDTSRAIQGMHEMFGLGVALLLVAGVTPIVEEFVFRGVLLQSFRGEVSFWFAAVLSSLAFTLMHESWADMPFLFVFAMVAALVVRRGGGLLGPMILHGVNNAIAVYTIVGVTHLVNR
jgi:membrane protease YdiL (CAAX protease family)